MTDRHDPNFNAALGFIEAAKTDAPDTYSEFIDLLKGFRSQ
jgi:hypothetical protein